MWHVKLFFDLPGVETITNRLDTPVPGLEDMFVTLQLNKPLLNEKQKQELNPMIINIHSVTNMPASPMTHEQLKDRSVTLTKVSNIFNL
jgi:hypothetical protein